MTLKKLEIDIGKIRGLIGRHVIYKESEYIVIEVLDEAPALVLETRDTVIQADQHGEAHRRVPNTETIPVLNSTGNEYSLAYLNINFLDD
ncbi:MAG: hypothetical protein COC09_09055 [Gammaproteobacteria bacterium]|nr:hypothetical protein [Gammaproteobacteria bacterium]PCH62232.1 MAG: hypothetical protein COC09_09055 [Gammaproteobacteria bacterium]